MAELSHGAAFLVASGCVISVALAAALSFVTVGCGTILGIEDVKEIQRSGTGGTGGATATAGTGGGAGGATCQPETCDSRGWQCGTGANGCNEPLNCGLCGAGESCDNAAHTCAPLPAECVSAGWQCGAGTDMNGAPIECGDCPTGYTCSDAHACVCAGGSCQTLEWQCGSGSDVCGNPVDCGPARPASPARTTRAPARPTASPRSGGSVGRGRTTVATPSTAPPALRERPATPTTSVLEGSGELPGRRLGVRRRQR